MKSTINIDPKKLVEKLKEYKRIHLSKMTDHPYQAALKKMYKEMKITRPENGSYQDYMSFIGKKLLCRPICQAIEAINYYKEQMIASHLRDRGTDKLDVFKNADHYYINEPELRKILRTHIANEGDHGDDVDMLDIILH